MHLITITNLQVNVRIKVLCLAFSLFNAQFRKLIEKIKTFSGTADCVSGAEWDHLREHCQRQDLCAGGRPGVRCGQPGDRAGPRGQGRPSIIAKRPAVTIHVGTISYYYCLNMCSKLNSSKRANGCPPSSGGEALGSRVQGRWFETQRRPM